MQSRGRAAAGRRAAAGALASLEEEGPLEEEDASVEDELDVEGEMEDDWERPASPEAPASPAAQAIPAVQAPGDGELQGPPHDELRQRLGMSEEEARLWERGADAMFQDGKFPEDIRQQLSQFASNESILDSFDDVAGSGEKANWVDIMVNETWKVRLAQVPGATARFMNLMRTETEVTDENLDTFRRGDTVWPSAIILSRWLGIQPPLAELRGKSVLELGAGLGLPSIVAASLGAAQVLAQDRDEESLRQALETAVHEDVIEGFNTLRCDWKDLPNRLSTAGEEVLQPFKEADVFLGADILFDEGAASDVADALSQLMRRPGQVAYVTDPYKRRHRRSFVKRCRSSGLEVSETEIITWEPEAAEHLENDADWVVNLLTIRRV